MPGPYNPLFYKTYNPNNLIWDVLAQFYEDSGLTTTPTTIETTDRTEDSK